LLARQQQGNEPTDERNAKKNIDDNNSDFIWAVSPDGRDGRVKIERQNQECTGKEDKCSN